YDYVMKAEGSDKVTIDRQMLGETRLAFNSPYQELSIYFSLRCGLAGLSFPVKKYLSIAYCWGDGGLHETQ
ncbi:hypothetical protein OUZ56_010539, partial [Daphnia magna]